MISSSQLWNIQEPILAMAAVIDLYLNFFGLRHKWQDFITNTWVKVQTLSWDTIYEVSRRFQLLFFYIYGERIISIKRIIASFVTSSLFVLWLYYLFIIVENESLEGLGYYISGIDIFSNLFVNNGDFIEIYSVKNALLVFYHSIGTNWIPDLISIIETGYILNLATKRKYSLHSLFIFDFFFTTIIWFFSHYVGFILANLLTPGFSTQVSLQNLLELYSLANFDPQWRSFVVSTYLTSLTWWLFIISVMFLGLCKKKSKLIAAALESKIVYYFPITLIVGTVCLISWLILFLNKLFLK